jgi:hypothetical protein
MKLSRRQFLIGLAAAGAAIPLSMPVAQATTRQVDAAWEKLLFDPWLFEVNEFDTIIDSSIRGPEIRSDVFEVDLRAGCTTESLIADIDQCMPLSEHFRYLAAQELERVRLELDDQATLTFTEHRELQRLAKALADADDGWANWISLGGPSALENHKADVEAWLAGKIQYSDYEWFPRYSTAQGGALEFFESLSSDTLEALGVVIVEGDHPGSTYYAAELRGTIERANASAERMELPFRFRVEDAA